VKVRGEWAYLYRAVDKHGNTIDFYLSPTRNAKAAKRFLGKTLNGLKDWEKPEVINTDKAPTYGIAISELKAEGKCPEKTMHRPVEYLNNVVEADHGKHRAVSGIGVQKSHKHVAPFCTPISCLELIKPDYCVSLTQRNPNVPERS
jgi:transposase-like protein